MKNKKTEDWIEYLRLCWRGKWIIIISFMLGTSLGIYRLVTTPRFYETEMILLIVDQKGGAPAIPGLPSFLQSGLDSGLEGIILAVLKSRRMGEIVAERFEFWQEGESRLHTRTVYEKDGRAWKTLLLGP